MIQGVFDALAEDRPQNHFTVGITDDVTHRSLPWDRDVDIEADDVVRAVFFGLGSDGTVGANKNSIKIIGEHTDFHAQGYFVYDSKKSGARTISHLRFGPRPIRSSYLVKQAQFVACHQWSFVDRYEMLDLAAPGGVFLLNAPFAADQVWDRMPREVQQAIIDKHLQFYVIDAYAVARDAGMAGRTNTVMQTCFFAISGVLPAAEAIGHIKTAIRKSYGKKGDAIVRMNEMVVDQALEHLVQVPVPAEATATRTRPPIVSDQASDFVKRVTSVMMAGHGDLLPVSAFTPDGTWPTATAQWEKRSVAEMIPVWDPAICIQCNKCAMVCPHAAVRAKVYPHDALPQAPEGFLSTTWKGPACKGQAYTIQVAAEDCTGCSLCSVVCPAKDKANPRHKALDMAPLLDHIDQGKADWDFFLGLPEVDPLVLGNNVKDVQLRRAAVRVLWRLRRLRRDALPQAAQPALRRPPADRERHGLLVHLRRQPADHALGPGRQRSRSGLVQLPVRGQRRVRSGHAPGSRPAQQPGADPAAEGAGPGRRRAGPGDPGRKRPERRRHPRPA